MCVICPSKKADTGSQTDATDDMARLRSRMDRDVTIEIGTMRDKNAQPVALDVSMKWMETTMDIRSLSYPSHIIKTQHGDLILDRRFQGKLYLKGTLLSTSRSRSFKSSYNFGKGQFSRDRGSLVDRCEEADIVPRNGRLPFESTRRPCSRSISISSKLSSSSRYSVSRPATGRVHEKPYMAASAE